MGGDGGIDIESEGEGGAAILTGDPRPGACADAIEERFDFEAQGLAGFQGGLIDMETGKSGDGKC